jgi:hypothetical protein
MLAALALTAAASTPALAEWRWIDDDWRWVDEPQTQVYQEETRVYEQQPTYYEERHYVAPAPVVSSREVFWDGGCEVTRIHMTDGTVQDERRCSAPRYHIVPPHRVIIDRIGRHFDRLRGYDY